jgi:phenylpropionate dioxygenase-like ring-hydroxylating dioxygenase large terminal subunit
MPIPTGWFAAMTSDELEVGTSKALHLFGEDMVIFRTESGEVKCLDAFCPHMGAHLGHGIHEHMGKGGEVKDETIVCPFHGWRFNGDGVCEEVPYATNMPPKVQGKRCLKVWHTREKNDLVWIWYHPENIDPPYDVDALPEFESDEWGTAEIHRATISTHIQDIAENGSDPAHFRYVHGTADIPTPLEVNFDGHRRLALLESRMHTPKGDIVGRIELSNNGPGQTVTRFSGICDTVLQGCITPIEQDKVQVIFYFLQKKDAEGNVPQGGVAGALREDIKKQLREDTPIWEHKKYWPMPILCDGDGPISKFRKWYSQYYTNYEEIKDPNRIQVIEEA